MSSCVFTINVRVLFPQLEVYNSVSNDSGHKELKRMKTGIHPNYKLSKVICSCGNTFETGSVKEEIKVETCSECHPFYTGRQKFAEAGGRVDRFNKKYGIKSEQPQQ
jgi:large subunit ribosomal protein L31